MQVNARCALVQISFGSITRATTIPNFGRTHHDGVLIKITFMAYQADVHGCQETFVLRQQNIPYESWSENGALVDAVKNVISSRVFMEERQY